MTVLDDLAVELHGPAKVGGVRAGEAVEDLYLACVSRALDDREIALQKQSRVFFQISGAGHEALLLGLARHLRPSYDWFFPYYRDRALVLGLGATPTEILLQAVGAAADPASGGRQMPCHWGSARLNVVSQTSATGSQCIPAVGCAEASRYLVRRPELRATAAHGDELTYVSLGEGATSEGEFWESLNTACTLHLPVLYVVADNGFAISVPSSDQAPAPVSDLVRGFAGLEIHHLDGTDYFEVRRRAAAIIAHVRAGVGPALIHADVTRPYSHSAADTQSKYRSSDELAGEAARDPIDRLERVLVSAGVLSEDEAAAIRARATETVAEAAREALAAPKPDPATVTDHVWALPDLPVPPEPEGAAGELVAMGEAIKRTLHEQMARDERIRVFGEDVADAREALLARVEGKGGVFGTTHGLQKEFGLARCFNTPLSEANIVGRAIGQGLRGLRPAAEIQFFDYIWPAMQQIKTEAATTRWRSNGAFSCPIVLRVPIGGYLQGGAIWHSQCGESIFAHVPGLLVAFPSRARDAAGLLRAALRYEDPVLFLEHKHLLRQPYTRDPFPDESWVLPFGHGRSDGRAPASPSSRGARPSRRASRPRPRSSPRAAPAARWRCSTCAPSSRGTTTWWPTRWPGPAEPWWCTRTCSPAAGAARWRPGSASTASRSSTRRSGGSARPTRTCPTSPGSRRRCSRRSTASPPRWPTCSPGEPPRPARRTQIAPGRPRSVA
jgi:2-oxoisovalerate dehydrogenase E1 component